MTRLDYVELSRQELEYGKTEVVRICGICANVMPCEKHPEEPLTASEEAMRDAMNLAALRPHIRDVLAAWADRDVTLPKPLARALANLDDAMARIDGLPF